MSNNQNEESIICLLRVVIELLENTPYVNMQAGYLELIIIRLERVHLQKLTLEGRFLLICCYRNIFTSSGAPHAEVSQAFHRISSPVTYILNQLTSAFPHSTDNCDYRTLSASLELMASLERNYESAFLSREIFGEVSTWMISQVPLIPSLPDELLEPLFSMFSAYLGRNGESLLPIERQRVMKQLSRYLSPSLSFRPILGGALLKLLSSLPKDLILGSLSSEDFAHLLHSILQLATSQTKSLLNLSLDCFHLFLHDTHSAVRVADTLASLLASPKQSEILAIKVVRVLSSIFLSFPEGALNNEHFPVLMRCYIPLRAQLIHGGRTQERLLLNSIRTFGHLAAATPKSYLNRSDFEFQTTLQMDIADVLGSLLETALPTKIRWNACLAFGDFLKNSSLYLKDASTDGSWERISEVLNCLATICSSDKNLKLRTVAAQALNNLMSVELASPLLLSTCLAHLEVALSTREIEEEEPVSFTQKQTLSEALTATKAHFLVLSHNPSSR